MFPSLCFVDFINVRFFTEKRKKYTLRTPKLLLTHFCTERKNSLETRAERAVLRAYVENQAILERILLYRASKYKHKKRPGY